MTSITSPSSVVDGTPLVQLVGVDLSLVDDVELVASNGVKEFRIVQSIEAGRTDTLIQVNVDIGLTATILAPLLANAGVPLTDSQWSLKWVVGADELGVVVSAPANHQQREVAQSEKFGGILADIPFGEQDQLVSPIVTSTNTIKETESNGKATGYFDGIEPTMSETITHYIFTTQDGRWRSRDEVVTPFNLGDEFTEEFGPEFT